MGDRALMPVGASIAGKYCCPVNQAGGGGPQLDAALQARHIRAITFETVDMARAWHRLSARAAAPA